jgi:hypothetical protein
MLSGRHRIAWSIAVATAFAFATSALAENASAAADCHTFLSIPLPVEAQSAPVPRKPPACASYRSYRGVGRPVDYAAARRCAWQERLAQQADLGYSPDEPMAWVVGGSLILADLYVNGAGVRRDVQLAMRFACESEEQMAIMALPDLSKRSPSAPRPFEFCDYAVSMLMINFCAKYADDITDDRDRRRDDALKRSMRSDERAAFDNLLAAERAYIDAHVSEIYQGGTIRLVRTLNSQRILKNLFRRELRHFEQGKWPVLSGRQLTTAAPLLADEYRKKVRVLRAKPKREDDDGDVTAPGLAKAEEAFSAYRDAWVAFARLRYPSALARIRAEVTLERYRFLRSIR